MTVLSSLSFDGGPTVPAPNDLRVTAVLDLFPDTGERRYVHVRFTGEGIVYDVTEDGAVVATDSETWDELADRLTTDVEPRCDECGMTCDYASEQGPGWCGNCGNCLPHCAHHHGCPAARCANCHAPLHQADPVSRWQDETGGVLCPAATQRLPRSPGYHDAEPLED